MTVSTGTVSLTPAVVITVVNVRSNNVLIVAEAVSMLSSAINMSTEVSDYTYFQSLIEYFLRVLKEIISNWVREQSKQYCLT